MKNIFLFCLFIINASLFRPEPSPELRMIPCSENVFVIITDGFRWQEVFQGADSSLINNPNVTPDTSTIKSLYWAVTKEERRKRLLPFFWNVIAKKGQLYGNRKYANQMNVANLYAISYPGYNEIFTGTTDPFIHTNKKRNNPNINVLEHLHQKKDFRNRIAIFSSWDVFPFIFNQKRNGLDMNSGFQAAKDTFLDNNRMVNYIQESEIMPKASCRFDQLTFTVAKEYIRSHSPRIVVIGFSETDEFAHQGRYDLYLQQANQFDRMVAELWHFVQTSATYRDKTSFIITTDHGRGKHEWSNHGLLVNGSTQTWLAVLGPGIPGLGEVIEPGQYYSKELAEMIAQSVGEKFKSGK